MTVNIGKILKDHQLLVDALEALVQPHQREIVNSTLRVEYIEAMNQNISFRSVLAWQGDAEDMSWSFPASVVEAKMDELARAGK